MPVRFVSVVPKKIPADAIVRPEEEIIVYDFAPGDSSLKSFQLARPCFFTYYSALYAAAYSSSKVFP